MTDEDRSVRSLAKYRRNLGDLVRCPHCSRPIPADAVRCPRCRVHFQGQASDFAPLLNRRPFSFRRWLKVAAIILLAAIAITVTVTLLSVLRHAPMK